MQEVSVQSSMSSKAFSERSSIDPQLRAQATTEAIACRASIGEPPVDFYTNLKVRGSAHAPKYRVRVNAC